MDFRTSQYKYDHMEPDCGEECRICGCVINNIGECETCIGNENLDIIKTSFSKVAEILEAFNDLNERDKFIDIYDIMKRSIWNEEPMEMAFKKMIDLLDLRNPADFYKESMKDVLR